VASTSTPVALSALAVRNARRCASSVLHDPFHNRGNRGKAKREEHVNTSTVKRSSNFKREEKEGVRTRRHRRTRACGGQPDHLGGRWQDREKNGRGGKTSASAGGSSEIRTRLATELEGGVQRRERIRDVALVRGRVREAVDDVELGRPDWAVELGPFWAAIVVDIVASGGGNGAAPRIGGLRGQRTERVG
jgi:hypothetical protein